MDLGDVCKTDSSPPERVLPVCTVVNIESGTSKTYSQILHRLGIDAFEVIGKGTFSNVRMCTTKTGNKRGKKMVLKIIDTSRIPDYVLNKFVPRELGIHRKLIHPNIVEIEDVILIGSRIFISMEFADGGDLLDHIQKNGAMNESETRAYFSQIVKGVEYCHGIYIAHRDLKCENILLDHQGNAKITDFGFCRLCADSVSKKMVLSRTFCGSTPYVPPEVLQNVPYDPLKMDIWSLGVVLYVMVRGRLPFGGQNSDEVKREHNKPRSSIFANNTTELSDRVKQFILNLLNDNIQDRPSIKTVAKDEWMIQGLFQ